MDIGMSQTPSNTMKAFVVKGRSGVVKQVPVPEIKFDEVLVNVKAAAINQTDWKHLKYFDNVEDAVVGCDFSGVVVKVGQNVTQLHIGDTVAGFVSGCSNYTPEKGAFAEYVPVKATQVIRPTNKLVECKNDRIGSSIITTFEGASAIGLTFTMAGICFLFHDNFTNLEANSATNDSYYLVWGGSSGMGQAVVQFAKYLGFKVIATASTKNHTLLKSIGCDYVLDYTDDDIVNKIKFIAGDNITHAFDAIVEDTTTLKIYEAVSSTRPVKIQLALPFDQSKIQHPKSNKIEFEEPFVYLAIDPKKALGDEEFDSPRGLIESTEHVYNRIHEIVKENPNALKHMPVRILSGFDSFQLGLDVNREGDYSGEKIVVRLRS